MHKKSHSSKYGLVPPGSVSLNLGFLGKASFSAIAYRIKKMFLSIYYMFQLTEKVSINMLATKDGLRRISILYQIWREM